MTPMISLLCLVGLAQSGAPLSADDLLAKGVEARRAGKHEEALEAFKKAHGIAPSPRTLGQMGLAEQSLKRWVDSELHLAQALASPDFPWVSKNQKPLEAALNVVRTHVGELTVAGPAGAKIIIDGWPVGELPLAKSVKVAEGTVSVRAERDLYQPFTRTLSVPGGAVLTVEVQLTQAQSGAPGSLATQSESPTLPASSSQLMAGAMAPEREAAGSFAPKIIGWSLIGAAAAGITAGVVFLAVDGRETCTKPTPDAICPRLYNTKLQGWASIGAGVLAGIGGGILIYRDHHTDVALAVTPSGVAATGRF